MSALFVVVFVMALVFILRGFFLTSRMSGQIFQLAQRRIEEELSRPAAKTAPGVCDYCGSQIGEKTECPQCGAAVNP